MLSTSRRLLAGMLAATALVLPALALAQASAAMQLVVPYPAGGPTDAIARAIAPQMAQALHRTIIVQNIAGASGAIASQKVLDGRADGQLVLVGDPNGTILAPLALGSVHFKPDDFILLRNLGTSPLALVGRSSLPGDTVDDLVAARTKGLTFGSSGIGSLNHLAGEDFRARTGLDMVHVPYKGGAQLLTDLLGGQVDLAFVVMNDGVADMVHAGRLKMYGVAAASRTEKWKEFPTLGEGKALKNFNYDLWAGLMVPRTTPPEVADALHQAADAAMGNPDLRAFIARAGVIPAPQRQSLAEVAASYQAEVARYVAIAKAIKLAPQ